MATNSTDSSSIPNPDDAHDDLMATLAAARELDPGMDKALAEQYLARRQEEQKKQQQNTPAVVPQQGSNPPSEWWMSPVMPAFGAVFLAALLVAAIVTGRAGLFWAFFWIPLCFGGWRWWGMGWYRMRGPDYRYQRYIERDRFRQARWEARHGYFPPEDEGDGQYGQQPRLPQQQQQQPTHPSQQSAPTPPTLPAPQRPPANGPFTGGAPPINPAG